MYLPTTAIVTSCAGLLMRCEQLAPVADVERLGLAGRSFSTISSSSPLSTRLSGTS